MTDSEKLEKNSEAGISAEGSMYLYQKPEYLNREAHDQLGWTMPKAPYAFAANIISVPLVISEIPSAQKFYPIIFQALIMVSRSPFSPLGRGETLCFRWWSLGE